MSTTDGAQDRIDAETLDEGVAPADATSIGLDENVAGALAYALGALSGLVVFLVESENRQVKWHGAQSLVVFLGVGVSYFVLSTLLFALASLSGPFGFGFAIVGLLLPLVLLGIVALWLFMLVRTFQGHTVRVPVAAGIADGIVD
jgi:uncharacterized membrane protein